MPIQYSNPFSQFVDPGSTEIAEEYKNRFLTNYSAASKIEQEMAALKAAPFEGDRNLRNQLVSSTQGVLNSLAEKGNYEHMTIPVMGAAKEYSIKSQPISENLARYQTYLEELNTARKEGKIDYEDYEGTLNLATKNYTGLVQNPDGTYGNAFSGLAYVERPDIQKMINDQINMVASDMTASERNYLSAEISKGDIVQTENGRYAIKIGNKVEYISEGKIEQAISSVFSDSQVQEYLKRKGKIRTANLTDEELLNHKDKVLAGFSARYDQLNTALDKASSKEEKQAISDAMSSLLQETGRVQGLTDPEQLRDLAARREISSIISEYTNAAKASAFTKVHEDSLLFDYDKMFLKSLEGTELEEMSRTRLVGQLYQQESSQGVTYEQVTGSTVEAQQTLNTLMSPESLEQAGLGGYSMDIILNTPMEKLIQDYGNAGAQQIINRRNQIVETRNIIEANNMLMDEVKREAGLDDESIMKIYEGVEGASEILDATAKELGVSRIEAATTLNTYLEIMAGAESQNLRDLLNPIKGVPRLIKPGGVSFHMKLDETKNILEYANDKNISPETIQKLMQMFNRSHSGYGTGDLLKVFGKRLWFSSWNAGDKEFAGREASDIIDDMWVAREDIQKRLNKVIKPRTRTVYSGSLSTALPGMTSDELKAINQLIPTGSGVNSNIKYLNPFTGRLQAVDLLVEDLKNRGVPGAQNFDLSTAQLEEKPLFNPYSFGLHGAAMVLEYKDKEGNILKLPAPLKNNLSTDSYTRLTQNPSYQFIRKVASQNEIGIQNITVPVTLKNGSVVKLVVNLREDFFVVNYPDGTTSPAQNLTAALEDDGEIAKLFEHGARF